MKEIISMRGVAVLRDLESENRVSMDRYADELLTLANAGVDWTAKDYVLDESGIHEVASALQKLKRYKRRYIDYPKYASTISADVYHIADHAFAHLVRTLPAHHTVITCHDLMLLTQEDWNANNRWTPAQALLRYSVGYLKHAAKVIADSDITKSDMLKLGLVRESQVVVIPPPVSPMFSSHWRLSRAETRSRLGLMPEDLVLLHVSSPTSYKNIETVIDVLAELRRRDLSAVLVRVGRSLPSELELRASTSGVQQWVHQLGSVSDREVACLYGAADVLIFPSVKEGFGWPVVEAMASGLPVVASDVDAITQSLGGSGIQASPMDIEGLADGVERVWSDKQLRAEMAQNGLERAKVYSRETVGSSLRDLYESIYELNRS